MMPIKNIKTYTIPLTGFVYGGSHPFRIVTFQGDRPDYTADGYGSGTSHTLAEIKAYFENLGIENLAPCVKWENAEEYFDAFGALSLYGQKYNTITGERTPVIPGIEAAPYDAFTVKRSPIYENAQTTTNPYFKLTKQENGRIQNSYIFSGGGGGGFLDDSIQLVWLSDNFYTSNYNASNSRTYKAAPTTGGGYHIENQNGGPMTAILYLLNQTGGTQEYEGLGGDPNEAAGISETGGGQDGTFDTESDPIAIPALPTLSAVDTGFVTIYNPTITQLKNLSSYMWNANPTTIEFWKKIVADPMDLILGLNIVPCSVPDGGQQSVKVGLIDTGIVMTKAASQYQELDCGSITIGKFWDNVMDYSPFTKAKIYLPYIGVQDLNIDEIMGKTIQVVYHIDILSCACTCMIKSGDAVLYTFNGQCGQNIPVSSANYATMISGMLQIAGAAVAIGVTGGAAAPAAAAGISSGTGTLLNGVPIEKTNPMETGIPAGAPGGGMGAKSSGGGGNAVKGTMQCVGNVMALKPSFAHSGSISGTGGQLAVQYPYLIFERPRQSLPQNYKAFRGYPSNITATLNSLTGYTEVDSIHLDGIPAMAAEIQEIDKLLKSGVIL